MKMYVCCLVCFCGNSDKSSLSFGNVEKAISEFGINRSSECLAHFWKILVFVIQLAKSNEMLVMG